MERIWIDERLEKQSRSKIQEFSMDLFLREPNRLMGVVPCRITQGNEENNFKLLCGIYSGD